MMATGGSCMWFVIIGLLISEAHSQQKWNIKYSDGTVTLLSGESDTEEQVAQTSISGTLWNSADIGNNCGEETEKYICKKWEKFKLEAYVEDFCFTTKLTSNGEVGSELQYNLQSTFSDHLYGGPEQSKQQWPLDDVRFEEYSYVTKELDHQAIAERYWLSSDGKFYFVQSTSPLFIQQNIKSNHSLEFIQANKDPYPVSRQFTAEDIICQLENSKAAHLYAVEKYLGKPSDIPDEKIIKYPIWSTWARYQRDINDSMILEFANEIREKGFKNSQIEIDDLWETCYGSMTFDTKKFPDVTTMTNKLKSMGFRVTMWVHPFINTDCTPYFEVAKEKGYLVTNTDGQTTTKWWNGDDSSVIDVTNSDAAEWWIANLNKLRDQGIDSFKFDAGETSWLPQLPKLTGDLELQPNIYSQKFAELAATFGNMIEIRTGFRTQKLPVFVRMIDVDSKWTIENGLPTLITRLLEMNLAGYPFVLPDMVGGNGYEPDGRPSKELFIRWLQANVFMPVIQYSFVPWDYDDETVEICKKYTELHEQYADKIIEAMKKAVNDGTPVNPPIWWLDPEDKEAQTVNDEFLLGESILVAPVLIESATTRNIYLPAGTWLDKLKNERIEGGKWIKDYPAALNELPYFELVTDSTTPGGSVPDATTPGGTVPDATTPGGTVPDATTPGGSVPDATTPGGSVPDATTPGGSVPDATTPGGSVPDATTPGGSVPDATTPGGSVQHTIQGACLLICLMAAVINYY